MDKKALIAFTVSVAAVFVGDWLYDKFGKKGA